MTQQLWILPVTFVFLSSSLIWFLIGCKGIWWLKLLMMAITGTLSIVEWRSIDGVFGYPKVTTVNEFGDKSATLYRMVVEEPKVILLWMKLDGDNDIRAYQIPYSRSIAKQEKAGNGNDGDPARIQFKLTKPSGGGSQAGHEASSNAGNSGGTYEIYVLPPPIVPEKLNSR